MTDGVSTETIILNDGSIASWVKMEKGLVFAGTDDSVSFASAVQLKDYLNGEHDEHETTGPFFRRIGLVGIPRGIGAIRGFFMADRSFIVRFESGTRPATFEDQGGSLILAVR